LRRSIHLLVAGAAVVIGVAAIPLAGAAARPAAATKTVTVKAGEMYFKLSTKTLAKPGRVTFAVKNAGHLVHDFKIAGKVTPMLKPGKSANLTVTFRKKGSYRYQCTVPGHAAGGMKGVFTVR
jgi:uncharacterized cupredoxin-like copper-binding protein